MLFSTDCLELLKEKAAALMQDSITSSNLPDNMSHSTTDHPAPTNSLEQLCKLTVKHLLSTNLWLVCIT